MEAKEEEEGRTGRRLICLSGVICFSAASATPSPTLEGCNIGNHLLGVPK